MSYSPTTWQDGNIITASALNKIEQGIADAGSSGGGGSNPVITLKTNNFSSYSHPFYFAFCTKEGQIYTAKSTLWSDGTIDTIETINIFGGSSNLIVYNFPILNNFYLLFGVPQITNYTITTSGNISSNTVTLAYGSTVDAYVITGDCEINITQK